MEEALNPIYDQTVFLLAALVLFTSFVMLAQTRLVNLVKLFALQGGLLAATTALVGFVHATPHLFISAGLTLVLKAALIPFMLHWFIVRLGLHRQEDRVIRPLGLLLGAASLMVFSYYIILPAIHLSELSTRNIIATSTASFLLGMLLMISHRQAISHVIGFMAMENALFFLAVVSTYGMPLVVELGIAFDVMVGAVIFGVFFFQIRESIDSLDVDRLNRLSHLYEGEEEK
ncbi:formate hydrogenlyase [Methylohalobius crimeensis]|uniref:formate hydrogenlyase n=1 Tax=Methylohalobius crimeensis TaxID=244365 RepID=UPI0003B3B2C4|nr:formate hydrogenlyase [Methylohalobius crimeensis]